MIDTGLYNQGFVAVSVLIAIVASYTALDLTGRARASMGAVRYAWLSTAGLAMGGGIWAMHFVGMLAFSLPKMRVAYDTGQTVLSLLLLAIGVTELALFVITAWRPTAAVLAASGAFMGVGIAAMHYTGMAAMQMPAHIHHDPFWIVISVLIAVTASTAALWVSSRNNRPPIITAASAIVMGAAISGMHYSAMQGVTFVAHPEMPASLGPGFTTDTLAIGVTTWAFLILLLALVAAMYDRQLALMAEREAAALRTSEERFRLLYRRTPLPLHALDENGCIEDVSDAWLTLMGYAREEVVGRPLINFMTEASARQRLLTDWPALLREGQLEGVEYRVVTRCGEFLDVVASTRLERDLDGRFIRALGGLADITKRKKAEEALFQAQKMEVIGQLTGGVAHDFNNLLAVVLGNLELLSKRLPVDQKAATFLEHARQGAMRGATLTQRMLAFARKQELRPEAVDVPDLVRGMTELLQHSLGPTIRVETHFPLGLPRVYVDAHQLELVLLNLAVNARDAMPEGGTLSLSAAEHEIPGSNDLRQGRYLCISIADTGTGMDPATLARAMEPFFTTKGVGKGTGLGLSMAHGLAEQSGGRLILRSELGRGTTAELWLPVTHAVTEPGRSEKAQHSDVQQVPPSELLEILVVDDDPLVLAQTAAMLEDIGHSVIKAASGEEALRILQSSESVDFLVTDYLMPGMNGLQLIDILQTKKPSLQVLLMSAFADLPEPTPAALTRLKKPFTQQSLAEAIAGVRRSPDTAQLISFRRRHPER